MKKPILVVMAAGMGSRYGGLKQIDPVDKEGHIIMDFSIFDAKRAGFEKVVFIIKKEDEADFKEAVGNRMEKIMDVAYACTANMTRSHKYHVYAQSTALAARASAGANQIINTTSHVLKFATEMITVFFI